MIKQGRVDHSGWAEGRLRSFAADDKKDKEGVGAFEMTQRWATQRSLVKRNEVKLVRRERGAVCDVVGRAGRAVRCGRECSRLESVGQRWRCDRLQAGRQAGRTHASS